MTNQRGDGAATTRSARGPVGKWAAQNLTIQALALKLPAHPADPDFDETISSRGYC